MKAVAGFCLLVAMTFGLSAFAEMDHEGPCKADREKYCAGLTMGHGLAKCMKKNEASLTAECKAKMSEMKEHAKEAHDACKGDFEKFCKDVKPGGGRIIKCMKEHEAELSPECKAMEHNKGGR